MRIALVHSYYSSAQPSGENVVVDAQAGALVAAGHEVLVVARHTDDLARRRRFALEAAWTVATGHGPDPTEELRQFGPDVVHVHNLFPNFGTRWLSRWPGPVVATLHNFRPMCAAGTLYRAGQVCTECPDGDSGAALRHGCFRGSRLATLPLSLSHRGGLLKDPVVRRADALIVLTEAARGLYEAYGVDRRRLNVLSNFVDDPAPRPLDSGSNGSWLFAGRLSMEKGIVELLQSWPAPTPLDVMGSGPLESLVRTIAPRGTRVLGAQDRSQVRLAMPRYLGLVFPSRWMEGLPTALLESLAAGLPVVAVTGSSAADLVDAHGLGVTVGRAATPRDWATALAEVSRLRPQMSRAARATYEGSFSTGAWLQGILALYACTVDTPAVTSSP